MEKTPAKIQSRHPFRAQFWEVFRKGSAEENIILKLYFYGSTEEKKIVPDPF